MRTFDVRMNGTNVHDHTKQMQSSSWVSPTYVAKIMWQRRSRRYWRYRRSRKM